ncbi:MULTISPECIES: sensor domain-containing diguanylate cyclase [Pseudomonas]|uniref:Putative GGDEF/GAF domain sensory box protein n=1 Tax=Pseudomonas fluorescens (strain Pf0-1) TaxID=205922 RepID=Q3KE87_PSEPF|nr:MULTISPECIES: sensor domain-containing diguanylate cyclase [Pseudomonas]ABA73919.1 putative GGDEF/GAF domain sensory box protein [Pseudomonas fluorescens Pf0-1]MBL0795186.1 sensor domain-containing diguanylate cyclase [Pseudomonas sp. B7]MBY9027257.1 sensor domain-containing diguanylate cyclase [Pseudomonas fluorescens]MBY9033072.1 sensor domain-containing diguanylate cyclase [Pseudomonas fluorescens]MBY9036495.1 sensor domain-containing diguanylate cyclase [Pseudomonas fluorescens]
MLVPGKPANEAVRIQALQDLKLLDTAPEERFDRLTRLAKRLFNVPIALVTLVDKERQWFKSCVGLDTTETPRSVSFCAHAILRDELMLVPDAREDERFHDNPLVTGEPNIRFYAGYPLTVPSGNKMGTLCLIDTKPRDLDEEERALLRDLAGMAEQELMAVQMASMDELTLLSNRRGFKMLAQHALDACARLEKPATLLFFDLNDFKQINDLYGHAEGDSALKTFADVLRIAFRESDVVGRLGGDEFVALLTGSSHVETTAIMARLKEILEERNATLHRGYAIRFSVGQIEYNPQRHESVDKLLADADAAMYEHKQALKRC